MRKELLCLLLLLGSCQKREARSFTVFEGTAMTLPYQIIIGQKLTAEETKKAHQRIQITFAKADQIINNWNPHSEISRINEAPEETPIAISNQMNEILTFCGQIVSLSGGRFDPTVRLLHKLWRESLLKEKKAPPVEAQQAACDALGWNHLSLRNGTLVKDDCEVQIDLSSVARGFCVDWLIEELSSCGYKNLFVEWAGAFRALGRHPEGKDWTVQVNPNLKTDGHPFAPILLNNGALATSGHYIQNEWILPAESAPDQRIHYFSPIIDPLSAQPFEKTEYSIATSTVIAPTCALADALSTAAMVFSSRKESESWAQEAVELYPEVSFWILSYIPVHRTEND